MKRSQSAPTPFANLLDSVAVSMRNGRDSNPGDSCESAGFQVREPLAATPACVTFSTRNAAGAAEESGQRGLGDENPLPIRSQCVDSSLVLAAYDAARAARAFREGVRR